MRYYALIPAAGSGSRFGGQLTNQQWPKEQWPKQYWKLDGKPMLAHSIERLAEALSLEQIYVAVAPDDVWFDEVIGARPGVSVVRCGGTTRAETVRKLLGAIVGAQDDDWILVHDAVRPCIDADSLARLVRELSDDDVGGLLAMPMVGTLKRAGADGRCVKTEPRDGLWSAQTPQMFRYRVLHDALARRGSDACTDEAQAVEALGLLPRLVTGSPTNLKITYPGDLTLAAAIMAAQRQARKV